MTFGFLIHPLSARYMDRVTLLTKPLPSFLINQLIKLKKPYEISRFKVNGLLGYFVGCPLTSEQMLKLNHSFVLKRIIQTCNVAKSLGVKIISLGAFSAIATHQGKDLIGKIDINVTTGRALTIGAVYEQVLRLKYDKVAIVGAEGAIGKGLCSLLKDVIKVGRKNFDDLYSADLIVSTTNTTKEIIDENKLKLGSVIIDVSKPSTIKRNITREDVKVIDGGLVKLPHDVNLGVHFDCANNVVFACMAEPMVLALEGKYSNYSIGDDISVEKVKEILELSKKHGFKVI
jgi:fatty aldehyde-generating acyl-ACP reductase